MGVEGDLTSGPGQNRDGRQEIMTKITLLRLTDTPRTSSIADSADCCLTFCSAVGSGAEGRTGKKRSGEWHIIGMRRGARRANLFKELL
jgi:hypothetical protein